MTSNVNDLSLYPEPPRGLIKWLSHLILLPKQKYLQNRVNRTVTETVLGRSFLVPPSVFNPVIFRTGRYLAEYIASDDVILENNPNGRQKTTLDVGTGCGIHAIFAAARGYDVTAVDINRDAVHAAIKNVQQNNLTKKITVLHGDLFAPVAGQKFDLVLCSLPKFRGEPETSFEVGWKSNDVIERFADGLPEVLKPDGVALVLLTTHGDDRGMIEALITAGLTVTPVKRNHFGMEILTIYAVRHLKANGKESPNDMG